MSQMINLKNALNAVWEHVRIGESMYDKHQDSYNEGYRDAARDIYYAIKVEATTGIKHTPQMENKQ